jgi:AcrR family transcriptional regulator
MTETAGLRERKKEQTAEAIAEAATRLMLERGFDDVSIAEVAEAANVSKMTVSNYFPSKEDLILGRIEDHTQEAARIVRDREPGESPLAALRRHFLERLSVNDPFTGLNDDEDTLAFSRMILATPSLELRFVRQQMRAAVSLALAFAEVLEVDPDRDPTPEIAANAVIGAQRTLSIRNLDRVLAGGSASRLRRRAKGEAEAAFDLLEGGLGSTPLAR